MDETQLDDIELEPEDGSDSRLAKLKRDLDICRKEKDDYLQGWQRAKADYANAERNYREQERSAVVHAEARLIRELLEIIDSFEGAFAASPPNSPWTDGIRNTFEKLKAILKRYHIEPIDALGKPFDPMWHEALEMKLVSDESQDGVVVGELQKGYQMDGRVIRPAKVSVGEFKK